MALSNATLKAGATSATIVGGTDVAFTPDGQTVVNGLHVAVAADTDFRTRRNITFKNKVPSINSDGSYTKAKRSSSYVQPKILADGSTTFNLVRVEMEVHPESTAAETTELRLIGNQMSSNAGLLSFWDSGNIA